MAAASNQVEAVVIGAGVIGLAVARALAMAGREVLIVERNATIGSETSSRNSQVIHAGLYYPTNSLKAQLCVKGNRMLYDYCDSHHIDYRSCGKLIVATTSAGETLAATAPSWQESLTRLYHQAIQNGVPHNTLQILSQQDVYVLEPELRCDGGGVVGALLSKSTGVIDSHALLQSLLADAEYHHATLALRSKVHSGTYGQPYHSLIMDDNDQITLNCRFLVNCAGLHAHHVAAAMRHNDNNYNNHNTASTDTTTTTASSSPSSPLSSSWKPPQQYFAKGTYFQLRPGLTTRRRRNRPSASEHIDDSNNEHDHSSSQQQQPSLFHHLIYPIPPSHGAGLGVHSTMDYTGQAVRFGPNVEWVSPSITNPDEIDLSPTISYRNDFYQAISTYWPHVQDYNRTTNNNDEDDDDDHALVADFAGIRPKLYHPHVQPASTTASTTMPQQQQQQQQDFMIVGPRQHGIPGVVHLFGIESPGLTSCLAIADHVLQLLEDA